MLALLLAAAVLPSINIHPDGAREYALDGSTQSRAGRAQPAWLWIGCRIPGSIELTLDVDARRDDFDFADFTGPAAPAHATPLSRLRWTAHGHDTAFTSAAGGVQAPGSTAFSFYVDEAIAPPGPLATLLRAIDAGGGTLEWTQTAFDDPHHTLRAAFALGATTAHDVKMFVEGCLAPPRGQ